MSDDQKRPRFTPLRPPRPTGPANREIARHHLDEVTRRQSDHEGKINQDVQAIATYVAQREQLERDFATAIALIGHEFGISDKLPERLRRSLPPPASAEQGKPTKPAHVPVHVNAQKSAQISGQSLVVLVLLTLLQIFTFLTAIAKGH